LPILIAAGALGLYGPRVALHVEANSFPGASVSWYVTNYNTSDGHWYSLGCNLGRASDQGGVGLSVVVVLDFGSEIYNSSAGSWGTEWTDLDGIWHTWTQAQAVIDSYAAGFWDCTTTRPRLTIAAGIRNFGFQSSPTPGTAGLAWAQLVNDFQNSLGAHASQVSVSGAIDAEPAWSSPSDATSWGSNFSGNGYVYYDYGSADGCPPYGSCNHGWSQSSEYTMAYGIPAALAIPEIYATTGANATQWQQISLWGNQHGVSGAIIFSGELTQWNACQTRSCPGTNNLPSAGWNQLYSALNSDSRTAQGTLPWSTDINWG
jgi:hypothetical protein